MPGFLEMPARMLVPRLVAASDVAAGQAQPQMHPVVAALQAFLAPVAARRDVADLGEMRAGVHRGEPCFTNRQCRILSTGAAEQAQSATLGVALCSRTDWPG